MNLTNLMNPRPTPPSTLAAGLRYGSWHAEVRVPNENTLRWLAEFLTPAFSMGSISNPEYRIYLCEDSDRWKTIHSLGATQSTPPLIDCFTRDGSFQQHVLWSADHSRRTVFDSQSKLFYFVDLERRQVELLGRPGEIRNRLGLMRVIRELATVQSQRQGDIPLHGSAVDLDGAGLLFVGAKRAGKTTAMIHAVRREGARFLANDRVFLRTGLIGVEARGMPTIMKIREGTMTRFPELEVRQLAAGYHRDYTLAECMLDPSRAGVGKPASLTTAQFCRLTGTSAIATSPVRSIIFPRISSQTGSITVEPLSMDETATLLAQSLLLPSKPPRLPELFARSDDHAGDLASQWEQGCREVAERVPAFRFLLGEAAYEHPLARRALQRIAA